MKKIFILVTSIFFISNLFAEPTFNITESKTDALKILNSNHPRNDGIWIQYFPLTTALRKNVIISDVITPSSAWENWAGKKMKTHEMKNETAENYDNSHNHYQNFLSEVLNFSTGTNAVAVWGDSGAVVSGSKAWGGFFSARSPIRLFRDNKEFQKYIPDDVSLSYDPATYDVQLTGVEIDVLNQGLPGVYPNMSKTGLQIVGFGNPNSMAIEVRSEDTDKKDVLDEQRRGVFESGIYFKNSIAPYGRLVVSDFASARIGLDFNETLFKEGAAKIRTQQVGSGIILNDGKSGEIYGGSRWGDNSDSTEWITVRMGTGGIRIVSNDNTKELVAIDNYGGIYINGDIYLAGKKSTCLSSFNYCIFVIGLVLLLIFSIINFILFLKLKNKK